MASQERDSAVERLEAALVEQDRLGECFDAAVGTSTEFGAYVRLRAAGDQVTAREAWVNWVDDEGYRGLNAGPFELLAERAAQLACTRGLEDHDEHRATAHGSTGRTTAGRDEPRRGDRRVGQTIKARRELATHRVGGRAWLNGRELGGADPRYVQLEASHD
jgi:hypothetical protein